MPYSLDYHCFISSEIRRLQSFYFDHFQNHFGCSESLAFPYEFEDQLADRSGPQAKEGGQQYLREAEKGKKTDSTLVSRKEHNPTNILILVQRDPFWTSDLKNCKAINLC